MALLLLTLPFIPHLLPHVQLPAGNVSTFLTKTAGVARGIPWNIDNNFLYYEEKKIYFF